MNSAVVLWTIVSATFVVWLRRRRRGTRRPPGPKGVPVLGNVFDIPKTHEWIKYAQWGQRYGELYNLFSVVHSSIPGTASDIIGLNIFGGPVVVLNSAEAATELMDQRSAIYSSRPRFAMLREL